LREKALAGVAVMSKDVEAAKKLVEEMDVEGTLQFFEGTRYATFVAVDEGALEAIIKLDELADKEGLRWSLVMRFPAEDFQTKPEIIGDCAVRTFCSAMGLPVKTKTPKFEETDGDGLDEDGYSYIFTRPSAWVIEAKVNTETGEITYVATLYGQYRTGDGLEYRVIMKKGKNGRVPVTKEIGADELASKVLNINPDFMTAMMEPLVELAECRVTTGNRTKGLLKSLGRKPRRRDESLTTTLGESASGLGALRDQLSAEKTTAQEPVEDAEGAEEQAEETVKVG
jgi:hypothetical protein